MDAPKCRLCEKRHWGSCANPVVAKEPRARKKSARPQRREKIPKSDELLARAEKARKPVDDSEFHATVSELVLPVGQSVMELDVCPECGTNLKARRKARLRRRKYMARKRAKEKGVANK